MAGSSNTNNESGSASLVDLYQLLGLTPLESDVALIQVALKKVAALAKGDEGKRYVKIYTLGQKFLLDPERKAQYDQQWKSVYQSSKASATAPAAVAAATESKSTPAVAVVVMEPQESWDYSKLDDLLPFADPDAPFDMAAFLRSAEVRDPSAAEADYSKLVTLLGGKAATTAVMDAPVRSAVVDLSSELMPAGAPAEHVESSVAPAMNMPVMSAPQRRKSAPVPAGMSSLELAKRARARRQRSLMLTVGGMLGLACILLAVGAIMMSGRNKKKTLSPDEQLALAQKNNAAAMNAEGKGRGSGLPQAGEGEVKPADAKPTEPKGSGLPKPGEVPPPMTPESNMPQNSMPPNMPADSKPMDPVTPPAATTPPATPPATTPPPTDPAMTTTPPTPTPATPMPDPMPAAVKLTAADKKAWKQAMEDARGLIGKQKFDDADKALNELDEKAKAPLQKEQLARLKQISSLAREFHAAVVDAIKGLGAAEVIKMGASSEASFVEGSESMISIRFQGKSQRYPLDQMPVGLAFGLADLKMDLEHPTSFAKKGAFALVHPKGNRMSQTNGQKMLVEAAKAGAVPADLPQVYDEDYSLKSVEEEK